MFHRREPGRKAEGRPSVRFSRKARRTGEQPISFLMKEAVTNPDLISLAAGLVDPQGLPVGEARDALLPMLADPERARLALQYGTTEGYERLRRCAIEQLERLEGLAAREMGVDIGQVMVTTGSQQLLYLATEILVDPDDIVLVGAPEYFVYMGTLQSHGARVQGVPMDEQGIIPEALEETLSALERRGELDRVKLLYHGSYFQNPSGVTTAPERRPKILEAVRRWSRDTRILIIEDAAYRELCYRGESPRSIRSWDATGDHVLLTHTVSKSYSPGLKLGVSFVPRDLVGPLLSQKGNHDFGSCNFAQHFLAEVIETGRYDRHVADLRELYREKLEATLQALDESMRRHGVSARWTRPEGGLYVWVILPEGVDTRRDGDLFRECVRRGVLYVPGEFCFPDATDAAPGDALGGARNTMRLTFGNQPLSAIREALDRLAAAVAATGEG